MTKYVFDSFAMIAYFEDEPGADKVSEILSVIMTRKAKGYMSVINWGEMYYNTMREQGVEEAEGVLTQFDKYAIKLIEADRKLTYEAAKIKARHKIAYADCFAAALTLSLNASLITGDPEFKRLSNKLSVDWIATKQNSR